MDFYETWMEDVSPPRQTTFGADKGMDPGFFFFSFVRAFLTTNFVILSVNKAWILIKIERIAY